MLRLLLAVLALNLVGCVAPAASLPPQRGEVLQPVEALEANPAEILETVAVGLVRAAPEVDGFWPGVWPRDRQVLLAAAGEGSLLIGPFPTSFEGVVKPFEPEAQLPGVLGQQLWFLPSVTLSAPVVFDFPLGDADVFAASIVPSVTHFDDPHLATTLFVYHELFHAFQESDFAPVEIDTDAMYSTMSDLERPRSEELNEQQRELERALLVAAVAAESDAQALCGLVDYYSQLEQRLPRMARGGEEYAERLEGTATYFAYEAAARALELENKDVQRFVVRDLTLPFPKNVERGSEGLQNWHMYAVGTAKTMLVARLVSDWQAQVSRGSTLDSLLLTALEREACVLNP